MSDIEALETVTRDHARHLVDTMFAVVKLRAPGIPEEYQIDPVLAGAMRRVTEAAVVKFPDVRPLHALAHFVIVHGAHEGIPVDDVVDAFERALADAAQAEKLRKAVSQ